MGLTTSPLIDNQCFVASKALAFLNVVSWRFLQTERDGQDKKPERLRGETDCVSLVQYGKKNLLLPEVLELLSFLNCGSH